MRQIEARRRMISGEKCLTSLIELQSEADGGWRELF